MCTEGTGLGTEGQCHPCSSPTWNDGSYQVCQQCATTSSSFDGKDDALSAGAVSPPAAVGQESCLPLFSELTVDQGTFITDTSMLTDMGRVTSVNACAAKCGDMCQFFTFTYEDESYDNASGNCFIQNTPTTSDTQTRKVFYRVNPGEGVDVSFGWYVRWDLGANELELAEDEETVFPGAETLNECLRCMLAT